MKIGTFQGVKTGTTVIELRPDHDTGSFFTMMATVVEPEVVLYLDDRDLDHLMQVLADYVLARDRSITE